MSLDGTSSGAISTSDAAFQIQEKLASLKKLTQECGLEIEKTMQMQQNHSLNYYKHQQMSGTIVLFEPTRKPASKNPISHDRFPCTIWQWCRLIGARFFPVYVLEIMVLLLIFFSYLLKRYVKLSRLVYIAMVL